MQWQETTGRFIDVTPNDLRIPYWPLLWEGQGSFWGSDPAGIHCFRKGRFVTYPLPHWLSRLRMPRKSGMARSGWRPPMESTPELRTAMWKRGTPILPVRTRSSISGIAEEISGRWVRGTTCSDSSITRHPGAWRDFRSSHSVRIGKASSGLEPLHKGYAGYAGKGRASLAEERVLEDARRPGGLPHLAQPQINRPLDTRGTEWEFDLAALPRRRIAGVKRFHHHAAVFAGGLLLLLAAHAPREVPHFVRRTVIPQLVEHRIAPTFSAGRFFHGVSVTVFAISRHGIAHLVIGVADAAFAVDLGTVVSYPNLH